MISPKYVLNGMNKTHYILFGQNCKLSIVDTFRLSVFGCPFVLCALCCQFLWFVRFWLSLRLVCPVLPVSLDCPKRTNQRNWQHRAHKTKGQPKTDNPEKLATQGTQDEAAIKNRQSDDVNRQKSYFHFRFNTNSGGFFPRPLAYVSVLEMIVIGKEDS
jgi:hypothetical protein